MNKKISKECFLQFKKQANKIQTESDLIQLEKQVKKFGDCFGSYKPTVKAFIEAKHKNFKEDKLNSLIKPFVSWKALKYNIKNEEQAEKKIKAIKKPYLRFRFEGLFNLLIDKQNLIYNPLYIRQKIIDDLRTFKSLNQFKVCNVSTDRLKKKYSFLEVKGDSDKFHTKIHFIEHGLYVLKTVGNDGVFLKALYIQYKVNKLFKRGKMNIPCLEGDKFNLHPINAWKVLEKEDNIKYYRYCNSMGFDKSTRDLSRKVKKAEGGKTFAFYLETIEDKLKELEARYASNSTIELENGSIIPNYELGNELEEVRLKYWSLTEEHNSDDVPTDYWG